MRPRQSLNLRTFKYLIGSFVNYVTQKTTFLKPSPLSQIFQRKKYFVFGLSQILQLLPLKRDVICERPLWYLFFHKVLKY